MASLNVAEWSPDQVADWLTGLGPKVEQYVPALRRKNLDGRRLLMLRCDDLEYLGVHIIGHQELMLEAVEHLRNFQYESERECVQQLAVVVSGVATSLARTLRGAGGAGDARLPTGALAELARAVAAVKPLACWLDGEGALPERRSALLKLSLEAATCAQRERFAEHPARAVAAAAAAAAATADYIIQDVSDPMILQPAQVSSVTLQQGSRPLGFDIVPSFCGHHQIAHVRFGSPAHASGAVREGDEILQVGPQCVVGWSGASVARACARPELALRVRRRGRAPPRAPPRAVPRAPPGIPPPGSDSEGSEPLSPPASPSHLPHDHTRMYPARPRAALRRRYTVCGGSPVSKRPSLPIDQFWQELRERRWAHGGSAQLAEPEGALYRRDKAVSFGAGLERSPRPRTCLGVAPPRPVPRGPHPHPRTEPEPDRERGKLDKSHSTPAYDFDVPPPPTTPGALRVPAIPESPTTPSEAEADGPSADRAAEKADAILDFKKSSTQIGEAILQQRTRRLTDDDEPERVLAPPKVVRGGPEREAPGPGTTAPAVKSLKKKNSLVGRRRGVGLSALAALGAACGGVWQRVRRGAAWRWARRRACVLGALLYLYRAGAGGAGRAALLLRLAGCTACAAQEVRSRDHAFKVYHTGTALYLAAPSHDAMLAWIQLLHRATLLPPDAAQGDVAALYSETDYSETESDLENAEKAEEQTDKEREKEQEKEKEKEKEKDKSKFGSLRKLGGRDGASLDRKYLRFFSRARREDKPAKSKQGGVPVPTDHYRSYRRAPAQASSGAQGAHGGQGSASPGATPPEPAPRTSDTTRMKIPKPINYIHASNPNLLDFEKSDFVMKPNFQVCTGAARKPDSLLGFVTLEQFMLQKQAEERRQVYTDRVLLGVQRANAKELQKQLDRIVADVIYGELPPGVAPPAPPPPRRPAAPPVPTAPIASAASAPPPPVLGKPISVKGKDGYEKIVYPDEQGDPRHSEEGYESLEEGPPPPAPRAPPGPPPAPPRDRPWRESLRRNDKVHSGASGDAVHTTTESWAGAGGALLRLAPSTQERGAAQYPHLVCPPTFHPETYSLARLAPPPRPAPPPPPPRPAP